MTRHTRNALLIATMLAGVGGIAAAVGQEASTDASRLPAIHGKVLQYDLTPRGDVDGLILQDNIEVHVRPDLGTQLTALVRPGDAVTIHGLKARSAPVVQALSVTADDGGRTLTDTGPTGRPPPPHRPAPDADGASMQAQGPVRMLLHGPRGDLNGALLQDGTLVHLPPPEAARLAASLTVGHTLVAEGSGVRNALGTAIDAARIGPDASHLAEVAHPPRPPAPPRPDAPDGGPLAPPPPGGPAPNRT